MGELSFDPRHFQDIYTKCLKELMGMCIAENEGANRATKPWCSGCYHRLRR